MKFEYMLLLFSFLLFFILFIEYKRDKASPLVIFLLIWSLIFILYGLGLYGINNVDITTELALIFGVIFFIFGFFFARIIKIKKKEQFSCQNTGSFAIIKVIAILDIIYMVPKYFLKIGMLLQNGWSLTGAKSLLGEGNDMFVLYIFDPFNFFLVALTSYLLIYNRKQKFLIIVGIVINAITVVATGSRGRLIFFILSFLSMIVSEFGENFKQVKKKVKSLVFLIFMIIVAISNYGFGILKSVYFYLCACVPLLDGIITRTDSHFTRGFTYGALSLNGILRVIPNFIQNYVSPNFSLNEFDLAEKYIEYMEYAKEIAPGEISNSFYSFVGNFYLDFGWTGIIIVSFIYGGIICSLYKKYRGNRDAKSKMILAFIYYAMFFSMVRCPWMNIRFAIGFIYIFLFDILSNLGKHTKVRREKNDLYCS